MRRLVLHYDLFSSRAPGIYQQPSFATGCALKVFVDDVIQITQTRSKPDISEPNEQPIQLEELHLKKATKIVGLEKWALVKGNPIKSKVLSSRGGPQPFYLCSSLHDLEAVCVMQRCGFPVHRTMAGDVEAEQLFLKEAIATVRHES